MGFVEIFTIAIALSMDAFAIAICKGLSVKKAEIKHIMSAALWFGGAQALMPVLGYFFGYSFKGVVESFDHWIAFVLLTLIGANMIREAVKGVEELNNSFTFKTMLPLAIASSIDALTVGVTFAFDNVNILFAAPLIGVTTFTLSAVGVKLGNRLGERYSSKAELVGGIVLILIAVKILVTDLFGL